MPPSYPNFGFQSSGQMHYNLSLYSSSTSPFYFGILRKYVFDISHSLSLTTSSRSNHRFCTLPFVYRFQLPLNSSSVIHHSFSDQGRYVALVFQCSGVSSSASLSSSLISFVNPSLIYPHVSLEESLVIHSYSLFVLALFFLFLFSLSLQLLRRPSSFIHLSICLLLFSQFFFYGLYLLFFILHGRLGFFFSEFIVFRRAALLFSYFLFFIASSGIGIQRSFLSSREFVVLLLLLLPSLFFLILSPFSVFCVTFFELFSRLLFFYSLISCYFSIKRNLFLGPSSSSSSIFRLHRVLFNFKVLGFLLLCYSATPNLIRFLFYFLNAWEIEFLIPSSESLVLFFCFCWLAFAWRPRSFSENVRSFSDPVHPHFSSYLSRSSSLSLSSSVSIPLLSFSSSDSDSDSDSLFRVRPSSSS